MEWTLILLVIGAAFVVLAIVAIRGSFRSDDAFYGESPTTPDASTTVPDEPPAGQDGAVSGDDGHGHVPSDGDGGIHDHGTGGG